MTLVAIVVLDAARVWWKTLRPSRAAARARRWEVHDARCTASPPGRARAFTQGFLGCRDAPADATAAYGEGDYSACLYR